MVHPLPPTQLFSEIAPRYDVLNKLLSLGLDKGWRVQLAKLASKNSPPGGILDLACGTGDMLSIFASHDFHEDLIGVDPCLHMLMIAKRKLSEKAHFVVSTGEILPFPSEKFGIVSVAFGLRNYVNLDIGLAEIFRVLVPNGILAVLEFHPRTSKMRNLFDVIFEKTAPLAAGIFGTPQWAYQYLVSSIRNFDHPSIWIERLNKAGFTLQAHRSRIFGLVCFWIFSKGKTK